MLPRFSLSLHPPRLKGRVAFNIVYRFGKFRHIAWRGILLVPKVPIRVRNSTFRTRINEARIWWMRVDRAASIPAIVVTKIVPSDATPSVIFRSDLSRVAWTSTKIRQEPSISRGTRDDACLCGISAFRHFGISVRLPARWQSQQRVAPWINELIAVAGRRKFLGNPVSIGYVLLLVEQCRKCFARNARNSKKREREREREKWRMVPG